ncbi:hypothetical protein, partial [Leptospira weilii]|uniref:hypothetical protein n=1 Tax=Leptospira weilii TaxID=28184 RepID=UPI00077403FE
ESFRLHPHPKIRVGTKFHRRFVVIPTDLSSDPSTCGVGSSIDPCGFSNHFSIRSQTIAVASSLRVSPGVVEEELRGKFLSRQFEFLNSKNEIHLKKIKNNRDQF